MANPSPAGPLAHVHRAAGTTLVEREVTEDASVLLAATYPGALDGPSATDSAYCVDLSHLSVFLLVGDDVRRWTNGMFTNNTRKLQPGQGNRHCACDDRGRVPGVLDLYLVRPDTVRIVLDGMSRTAFESRYQMYLMLDDIELEDGDPPLVPITVQGPGAAGVLDRLGLPTPPSDHGHVVAEGDWAGVVACKRDRTGLGGFDLLVSAAEAPAVWQALLEQGVQPLGLTDLDTLRVVAGRAAYPTDASDKSMVHELRLNDDCCAFDKGCYVGQEVINRIDVKGAIQKRLTTVVLDGPVPVGSEVRLDDKVIGRLTSRASYQGREVGLGVLRKAAWEPGTVVAVVTDAGTTVRGEVVEPPVG